MKIKLTFLLILFLILSKNVHSNINDKIIAKIGTEIITNYDIINEVNTILALSNRPADESEFKIYKILRLKALKKKFN